jgi:hypothetical protein
MTDWVTVSSLATAGATLVLAGATFTAVRSSNRSARIAEQALMAGRRPLLQPSRLDDPPVKFQWMDDHWARLEGSQAHVVEENNVIYLALSLRNVGAGVAVIQGWYLRPERTPTSVIGFPPIDEFTRQGRDLYVGASEVGFWQAALRDRGDELYDTISAFVAEPARFAVDLLYSDLEGGQRTMTRFSFNPFGEGRWMGSATLHLNVDNTDPR